MQRASRPVAQSMEKRDETADRRLAAVLNFTAYECQGAMVVSLRIENLRGHFNKGSRKRRCSRTKAGRRCISSENFGSPAPKKGEQPSPVPQMSGRGVE